MRKIDKASSPNPNAIATESRARCSGDALEVFVDEAEDECSGYQAVCPALDLAITAPTKADAIEVISRRIEELSDQPESNRLVIVDLEARRDAEDEAAALAAEARYRAMGTAGLSDFDAFVHPSDMPQ